MSSAEAAAVEIIVADHDVPVVNIEVDDAVLGRLWGLRCELFLRRDTHARCLRIKSLVPSAWIRQGYTCSEEAVEDPPELCALETNLAFVDSA